MKHFLQVVNEDLNCEVPRHVVHRLVSGNKLSPAKDKNNVLQFDQDDVERIKQWLLTPPVERYKNMEIQANA